MYEGKTQPVAKRDVFIKRLVQHVLAATCLLVLSLWVGVFGYCKLEHLSTLDAFLNATMLLGGMGPVNAPVTAGGKLFASLYALYAGLVFAAVLAIVFAPVAHRLLHEFHADKVR